MIELWYDSIKTSAQMELMCLEEPSLVAYNYGEDLQVLREQLAELRESMQEFCDRVDSGEVRSKYTYAKFKALLQEPKP